MFTQCNTKPTGRVHAVYLTRQRGHAHLSRSVTIISTNGGLITGADRHGGVSSPDSNTFRISEAELLEEVLRVDGDLVCEAATEADLGDLERVHVRLQPILHRLADRGPV